MTATVEGVVFELRPDLAGYRWYWPDGKPTDIWRQTAQEAERAMAFLGQPLAREAKGEIQATSATDLLTIERNVWRNRAERAEARAAKLAETLGDVLNGGFTSNARAVLRTFGQ